MSDKIARCYYCGHKLSRRNRSTDHVRPLSKGGSNKAKNKVRACLTCNGDKGRLMPEEWRVVMAFRKGLIPKCQIKFFGETIKE